jgi:hypothetical protein
MRNQSLEFMQANFGKVGSYYYWISRGVDDREVRANRVRKSVGHSFGAGMGFAVVSPWAGSGVSTTTFEIGTGLYFIVMAMISSAVGGPRRTSFERRQKPAD